MTDLDRLDALAEAAKEVQRTGATSFYCDPATIRELVAAIRERDELREGIGNLMRDYENNRLLTREDVLRDLRHLAALHREDGQPDENERCAATYWNGKRTVTCGELRVNRVHHGEGGAGHEFALHREDGA